MNQLTTFSGIKGLYRYGNGINSYDVAKFLAILFMVIDHLGMFIFMDQTYLRGLGRVAFPIFFFLIGYSQDSKTSWNLLIIGVVLSLYKGLLIGVWFPFDILITAFLSKLVLRLVVKRDMLTDGQLFVSYAVLIIWHIGVLLIFSYGTLGVMFAICGHLKRNENEGKPHKYLNIFILITVVSDYLLQRIMWYETEGFKYIFTGVSIFLIYYFMNFSMRNFAEIKNKIVVNTVLFFSRNSLFIYWLHYVIFLTASVLLYPDKYVFF